MRDLFGHGLNQGPEWTHVVHMIPSVFAIGVLANRCHSVAWPAPRRFSLIGLLPSADILQWPSMVVFLKRERKQQADVVTSWATWQTEFSRCSHVLAPSWRLQSSGLANNADSTRVETRGKLATR